MMRTVARRIQAKPVFIALAVAIAVCLPILSFDFGITEDEQLHNQHGKSILDYFLGTSDAATRHPLDADGDLTFDYDTEMRDRSGALNIYGGFFDLLCVATHRYLSPLGEFENRHFVNSLFGGLLILFVGLTAARIAGWRAGILGLLLAALSPRIVAHSMNNPVDLPFAALYLASVYFVLKFAEELPRPSRPAWIPLLICIPLATDVRIAGLVILFYLVLFAGVRQLSGARGKDGMRRFGRSMAITVLVAAATYLLVSVLWPLAHANPFTTPLMALRHLSRLETFSALDLFEGRWIDRTEIPWYFVPKWFLMGTPLFVPLGLLLSPLAFVGSVARRSGQAPIDRVRLAMVAFTGCFPVCFVILRHSNVYNDARHVLFALPPLLVLGAVGFESVLRSKARWLTAALAVILAGTLVQPLLYMVRNHSHPVTYFSPLVGGVEGAWKRYETDFWGNSVREAVEWIQENAEPVHDSPVRVRIWFGDQEKAAYYVRKRPGFEHVIVPEESSDWDYRILQTVECKFRRPVLAYWPPPRTVYEVTADGIPLGGVVINHRNREPEEVLEQARAWAERRDTYANWYSFGLTAYLVERHEQAIAAYERAAAFRPEDAVTRHAICVSHGAMERWDESVAACEHALRLDPRNDAARASLVYGLQQRTWSVTGAGEAPLTHDEYVNESLALFHAGAYEASVEACRLALIKEPASSVAHNNLCAAYNGLGAWRRAREACETALALEPDDPLIRGNLNRAIMGTR